MYWHVWVDWPCRAPQDVPPANGFPEIPYQRHLPKRGPPGWALFGGMLGIMAVGWYMHQINIRIHQYTYIHMLTGVFNVSELEREKRQVRLQILPILQAEQDLEYLKAVERTRMLEAIATADDPSWEIDKSVYNRKDAPRQVIVVDKGMLGIA